MLTAEQLAARKSGLGGSDVAAALGLSPYKSPLDVYNEKLGLVEPDDLSDNEAVHFGNVLEDVVADEFARRSGLRVRRNNQLLVHREHPFLLGNIDRAVVGQVCGLKAGLECKTAGAFAARPELWGPGSKFVPAVGGDGATFRIISGDDQVPDWYLMQCAHYMAVTNSDLWFLAVLIGGNEFRLYVIGRDMELEAMLVNGAIAFWHNNVLAGVPPEPSRLSDLDSLYPRDNGAAVVADLELLEVVDAIKTTKAEIKTLEQRLKGEKIGRTTVGGLEFTLKAYLGERAELLQDPEGFTLATWKTTKDSTKFDADAFAKAHPELFTQFTKPAPGYRRLLIK